MQMYRRPVDSADVIKNLNREMALFSIRNLSNSRADLSPNAHKYAFSTFDRAQQVRMPNRRV